jgi:carboxymethylenebutenolidase
MGELSQATPPSAPPSFPEAQIISPHITLQAPLSRHGKGPGLVLILDHYALNEKSEKHLDPPPLQKWAEEGFAVVQLLVPGKVEDGGEFPLKKVLDVLKGCEGCEFEKGVGLICKSRDFVPVFPSILANIKGRNLGFGDVNGIETGIEQSGDLMERH